MQNMNCSSQSIVASVVIPVYNKEKWIDACIGSLSNQTIDHRNMEAIFVNDGSTDNSEKLLAEAEATYEWVRVISQKNSGVCEARNTGIRASRGRYIFYLDPDDTISPNTLNDVTEFFDYHYDEIDVVTYRLVSNVNGKRTSTHYRYKFLTTEGIYDLDQGQNWYICQTTMNICVKNRFSENSTFDFESLNGVVYHEDQEYITKLLLERRRIGYVPSAKYYWLVNESSTTSTIVNPMYIFENTMLMYEKLFASFLDSAPRYLQALFLHDLNWKIRRDVLLPYHYNEEDFRDAIKRIECILEKVEVETIVCHPILGDYRKALVLQHKHNANVRVLTGFNSLALLADNTVAYYRKGLEAVLIRTVFRDDRLRLVGFLKNPCFQYLDKPEMYAIFSTAGKHECVQVPLSRSSWGHHQSKMATNVFWDFDLWIDPAEINSVSFIAKCAGVTLDIFFSNIKRSAFSHRQPKRLSLIQNGFNCSLDRNRLTVRKITPKLEKSTTKKFDKRVGNSRKGRIVRRAIRRIKQKGVRIWLYYDCHGVDNGNAYYQFLHDLPLRDGVHRYFVVNDPLSTKRGQFTPKQMRHVIRFGEDRHKLLFLAADKIITAYIEEMNWIPFSNKALKYYLDLFNPEIVYLQHGILHAHMPWKYSADRLLIDKIVASSTYEVCLFQEKYGFKPQEIIASGAPRYDYAENGAPDRKILFAPSWRSYLVESNGNGSWRARGGSLQKSTFYRELSSFLNSPLLHNLLRSYGYSLDVKLHPIMQEAYGEALETTSELVRQIVGDVETSRYAIFITDFSSYRFDFVYLKRTLMYFLPDEMEFKAGMCSYRETDLPLEGQFGDMARTADEAIRLLGEILENDGKAKSKYQKQMDDFFLYYDNNQCERIYLALSKKSSLNEREK